MRTETLESAVAGDVTATAEVLREAESLIRGYELVTRSC